MYWEVKATLKDPTCDMPVVPEEIKMLVQADSAEEAMIKIINSCPQFVLFVTSVKLTR